MHLRPTAIICWLTLGLVSAASNNYPVTIEAHEYGLRIVRDEVAVWSMSESAFIVASNGTFSASVYEGVFSPQYDADLVTDSFNIDSVDGRTSSVTGWLGQKNVKVATFKVKLSDRSDGGVDMSITVTPESGYSFNRIRVAYQGDDADYISGLGAQYSKMNLQGLAVPVLTQEQGVGRGREPITLLINKLHHGAGGSWNTTYSAIPHFVTNTGQSIAFLNTEYSVFDFTNKSEIDIDIYTSTGQVDAVMHFENSIPDAVGKYTAAVSGRMSPVPKWASGSGAIVGLEGGTQVVLDTYKELQNADVPVAAFWLQDWSGVRVDSFGQRLVWNWEVSLDHYPNWGDLLNTLHEDDVRVMTYINPHLTPNPLNSSRRNLFDEAADLGYLVTNSSGQPYIQSSGSEEFTFGTVDLTNSDAVEWYSQVIQCNMLCNCSTVARTSGNHDDNDDAVCGNGASADVGQAGWMADFGEYLPFDAVLANDADPHVVHNAFPELWAETNQDAVNGTDAVYFLRASSIHSPGAATLFWMGDQLVTYDAFDGMQSAMIGAMTAGLSGLSLTHSDIGGYTMLQLLGGHWNFVRSENLLMRWMEMSAFADAVYRTHPGNLPNSSAQFDTSKATLDQFAKFANVHKMLYDYRADVMQEALDQGAPLVRPLYWHFPNDPTCWGIETQFMMGSEALVAPTFSETATKTKVYFPAKSKAWTHLWSGNTYDDAGKTVSVDTPIGEPAVFYQADSEHWAAIREALVDMNYAA